MGTRLIKHRRNGCSAKAQEALTDQMQVFLLELKGDLNFNGTEAARKAGYKHPQAAAARLLKNPKIQAALGKALRERAERCELKADAVLNYLQMALFINPMRYFIPADDGSWLVEDPDSLPDEVGQLIESVVSKTWVEEDGTTVKMYKVTLVSHTVALGLAMKHLGLMEAEKRETSVTNINWDTLCEPRGNGDEVDPIEQQIIDVGK